MKPGLYALASLSGAPLDPADIDTLGFSPSASHLNYAARDFAVSAIDTETAAIHVQQSGDTIIAFAGYLDEPEDLASTLDLAPETTSATLASTALERFGVDASAHMLGEWSLLRWHLRKRELTLLASEAVRDQMFFAAGNGCLAVTPSAMRLGQLSWVGLTLDPHGFALNTSRAGLRHIRTTETMWKGVSVVAPASCEVFTLGSRVTTRLPAPPPPEPWRGSFEQAVEALETTGRRIMRQHMTRHPRSAFLLSGGLDSTLLTSWGAYERRTHAANGLDMVCLSSLAMPGSKMPDEREFSTAAADALGVPLEGVWPRAGEDLFRPSPDIYRLTVGPGGPQFPVWEQLGRAAVAAGATALIGGSAGEMHVSHYYRRPETRRWPAALAVKVRDEYRFRRRHTGWPANAFHLRLAPEFLQQLPPAWARVWRKGPPRFNDYPPGDPPMGIHVAARKNAAIPTGSHPGLRHLLPYRDQRLLRLAAGMPVSFTTYGGRSRALARTMLIGRVPESVWSRQAGRPFFPDYVPLLKAQAPGLAGRLPLFREAGVGRWLDLDWFPKALARLAVSPGTGDYDLYYDVHGTALMAEFLLWAAGEGVHL